MKTSRGAVMIFVLVVLLAMALAVGAWFSVSARSQLAARQAFGEQVALTRADLAAQQAIRDIRSGNAYLFGLLPVPPPDGLSSCPSGCVLHPVVDHGPTQDLGNGGGLQWDYLIYKSAQQGTPSVRYVVQANGYYGYTTSSVGFTSARVEVEVDLSTAQPQGTGTSYETGSGFLN